MISVISTFASFSIFAFNVISQIEFSQKSIQIAININHSNPHQHIHPIKSYSNLLSNHLQMSQMLHQNLAEIFQKFTNMTIQPLLDSIYYMMWLLIICIMHWAYFIHSKFNDCILKICAMEFISQDLWYTIIAMIIITSQTCIASTNTYIYLLSILSRWSFAAIAYVLVIYCLEHGKQPNKTTVIDEEPKEQLISGPRGYYAIAKESVDRSLDFACLQGFLFFNSVGRVGSLLLAMTMFCFPL